MIYDHHSYKLYFFLALVDEMQVPARAQACTEAFRGFLIFGAQGLESSGGESTNTSESREVCRNCLQRVRCATSRARRHISYGSAGFLVEA